MKNICEPKDIHCEFIYIPELTNKVIEEIKYFVKRMNSRFEIVNSNDCIELIDAYYTKIKTLELMKNLYLVYIDASYNGRHGDFFKVYNENDFNEYFIVNTPTTIDPTLKYRSIQIPNEITEETISSLKEFIQQTNNSFHIIKNDDMKYVVKTIEPSYVEEIIIQEDSCLVYMHPDEYFELFV